MEYEEKKNIVDKLVKVDFHIHSVASEDKDGSKVEFNTLEHVNVLYEKLVKNEINMAAITDHNAFDYNMYKTLKSYEDNKLNKVLPGIEFDVEFEDERIHVITIFNDKYDDKVSLISEILSKYEFDNEKNNAFTEKSFKEILKKIDLNVLLIAHQKSGVRSEMQNENLSKIGEEEFDEIIGVEYFDAVEFRSGKVEGILKDYKFEKNLSNLKYITGTDCHNWSVYPKQDPKDKTDIKFSYLKCLPTFKGLVMALTDSKRVTTAKYLIRKPFVESIELSIDDIPITIPLSSGLNVIIGDNSIGKSLLLESLYDPSYSTFDSKKRNGYKNYLEKQGLKIIPFDHDSTKNIHYDRQGNIRNLFQSGTKLLDIKFFKDKFLPLDNSSVESQVLEYVDRVLKKIKANQETIDIDSELNFEFTIPAEIDSDTYLLRIVDDLSVDIIDYNKIISLIDNIFLSINSMNQLEGFEDKEIAELLLKQLKNLKIKYVNRKTNQERIQKIASIIKAICKKYENENKEKSECHDNLLAEFHQNITNSKLKIIKKIKDINKNNIEILDDFEEININRVSYPEGKYKFVTQTGIDKISKKDIEDILTEPLSRISSIADVENNNINEFSNNIKEKFRNGDDNYEKIYKEAVINYLNKKYLKQETNIYYNDVKIPEGNSQGRNAIIYLDVLSDDTTSKLYMVDQPDDDISHLKLKTDVISIMKRMSDNKQILFITHKPELVVNLDVDNVIVIKEQDNKIVVNSGALEYEDDSEKINILKDVADLLDGGEDTIRKRWKRYDK